MAEENELNNDLSVLVKAANFAAIKHKNQMRKDGTTPYINHPIGVAHILTSEGKIINSIVLQAAFLHDTVEDTETTLEEIEEHFGSAVRRVVAEVTDDKSLPRDIRKRLQIEHASAVSHEARLVKLADKLYNLRDLLRARPIGWTEERAEEYFLWAAEVVRRLKGTNALMEQKLEEVLNTRGISL